MTWDDFWWLRIAYIIVSIANVSILGTYLWHKRSVTPRRYRRIGWAFWFVLVASSYASGRAASLGAPVAEHTLLVLVSTAILTFALVWTPQGDNMLPPIDGSMYERAKKVVRYYRKRLEVSRESLQYRGRPVRRGGGR